MLNELKVFLLAMTPIGELRLSIPIGITIFKLDPFLVFLISVLGNLLAGVSLLLFLEPASQWLSKSSKTFAKFFNWLFERTRNRIGECIAKRGWPALIPFVAIPLPITGAWTGCLIAFLFKIPFKKALPAIALGVIIAGVIVTVITQAGITVEHYFGWKTLIFLTFLVLILLSILQMRKWKTEIRK